MQLVRGDDGSPFRHDPDARAVALLYATGVVVVSVALTISLLHVTGKGCGALGGDGPATARGGVALAAGAGQLLSAVWRRMRPSTSATALLYGTAATFWMSAFWVFFIADCR